jgi:hypothetical protein
MLHVLTLHYHDQVWINNKEDSQIRWIVIPVKQILLQTLIMQYKMFLCVVVYINMYVIALKVY